jgi:hypothetical protein
MTQASQSKPQTNTSSLGAAAAAAATGTPKPDDKKPDDKAAATGAKPDDKKADDEAKKERNGSKVYVVVGTVHEFESVNKAEKFLNGEGAPTDYSVIRGKKITKSTKVSLR